MAGIYIHIPFCKQKCTYCDFHFSTTFSDYRSEMIEAILKEIDLRKVYLLNQQIQTIYFGGGTPSLLTENEIVKILTKIRNEFIVLTDVEVTLEANPDDITEEKLAIWKHAGVNRLSIGLQSFKESDLKWMNRAHTVEEANQCVSIAQNAGFKSLTVDLIYGLPNLSLEEWQDHIQRLIDLKVPHISAYCLTVESNTALDHLVKKGKVIPSSDEAQAEQFLLLIDLLEKNGYEQYEISNFCLKNSTSLHNSNYWKGEHYLGIGPSAHSFDGKSRSWNVANNRKYIKGIQQNRDCFETETLSNRDLFNETILTGLRTKYGVGITPLKNLLSFTPDFESMIKDFKHKNWLTEVNERYYLTQEGKLMADYITSELFII
tara:strand:+ start:3187 stop:4311 length:1125 start_codon:yes stop_codon:yes gene_type:complete